MGNNYSHAKIFKTSISKIYGQYAMGYTQPNAIHLIYVNTLGKTDSISSC